MTRHCMMSWKWCRLPPKGGEIDWCTERFFQSVTRFVRWHFGKFHRPVGWYCSYLLRMQALANCIDIHDKTLRQSRKNALYVRRGNVSSTLLFITNLLHNLGTSTAKDQISPTRYEGLKHSLLNYYLEWQFSIWIYRVTQHVVSKVLLTIDTKIEVLFQ